MTITQVITGDIELEAQLSRELGSHWYSHMPKGYNILRYVDWSNPVAVDMSIAQV